MAATLQTSSSASDNGAGTVPIPVPSGTAIDDLLVVWIGQDGSGTITAPDGTWTVGVTQFGPSAVNGACWYKIAESGDTSGTLDFGAGSAAGIAMRITGFDAADPWDDDDGTSPLPATSSSSSNESSWTAPTTGNTSEDDALVLFMFAVDRDTITGFPTTAVNDEDEGNVHAAVSQEDQATAGQTAGGKTWSGFSDQVCAAVAAIHVSAGAPGGLSIPVAMASYQRRRDG